MAMIKKEKLPNGQVRVTFELPANVWADTIHLVGSFNAWNRTSHPLRQQRDGSWSITIDLPANQEFEFRYLLNGTDWHNDWAADKYVRNEFGSDNSVVITSVEDEGG
jgi:1,4-alpha-glucan branching enzyme